MAMVTVTGARMQITLTAWTKANIRLKINLLIFIASHISRIFLSLYKQNTSSNDEAHMIYDI